MNLKANDPRTVAAGAFLIGLGLVWWLNLWWLILPGALVAGGVLAYVQRRAMGRTIEAVQGGLWGLGLGLLFLLGFFWPGILFLAGASILARGHEHTLDSRVQQLVARVRRPAGTTAIQPVRTEQVPLTTYPPQSETRVPVDGETTRLP